MGPTWKCWNRVTVNSWCNRGRISSPHRRRPLVPAYSVLTIASSPIFPTRSGSEAARKTTKNQDLYPWRLFMWTATEPMSLCVMATPERASPPRRHVGSPHHDRLLDGRLSRRLSGWAYPFGPLPENWASTGTPRRSMLKLRVPLFVHPKQVPSHTIVMALQ